MRSKNERDYTLKVRAIIQCKWKWTGLCKERGSESDSVYTVKGEVEVEVIMQWKVRVKVKVIVHWKWKWLYAESGRESESDYTMKGEVKLIM